MTPEQEQARALRSIDLDSITLEHGSHNPDHTFCVMELSAYIAGEPWSDHPECVSPAISAFLRSWNDGVPTDFRQRLKPYAVKVLHTNTGAADETTRAWMATDWLVRVQAPAWLSLAGLTREAANLRDLPALTSSEIATAVQVTLSDARAKASAAWAAAWDAAGAAAWDAAGDAARDAAWAAAGDAAWAAARDAARDAAGAAAWDAARDAARDAAGAAAWDAARDAAGDAAWAAARKRLAPTVVELQESAFGLLDRMIAVGKVVV